MYVCMYVCIKYYYINTNVNKIKLKLTYIKFKRFLKNPNEFSSRPKQKIETNIVSC